MIRWRPQAFNEMEFILLRKGMTSWAGNGAVFHLRRV
jgi:hypothetical protein